MMAGQGRGLRPAPQGVEPCHAIATGRGTSPASDAEQTYGAWRRELIFAIDETLKCRVGGRIYALELFSEVVRSLRSHVDISYRPTPVQHDVAGPRLPYQSLLHSANRHRPGTTRELSQRPTPTLQDGDHLGPADDRSAVALPAQPATMVVADGGYAVMDMRKCCQSMRQPVAMVTWMRIDESLCGPAPPYRHRLWGSPWIKGARLAQAQEPGKPSRYMVDQGLGVPVQR